MKTMYPKWIHWGLWVKTNELEDMGKVISCYTEGNLITFVTSRGEFSFYTDRGLALSTKTKFSGDNPREALLLPPEK